MCDSAVVFRLSGIFNTGRMCEIWSCIQIGSWAVLKQTLIDRLASKKTS